MKTLINFINEAKVKKPSDLKKYKHSTKDVMTTFVSGDIYSNSDYDKYEDTFTYYTGSGDGYITDKKGNVYDVIASDKTQDAGRIAGGAHTYSVTIKNANNGKDIIVRGGIAVFSSPSSNTATYIIDDIKAGYYLEDYLAIHKNDISDVKSIPNELFGDTNARSYEKSKVDKKADKTAAFFERYLVLPYNGFRCTVKNGKVIINSTVLSNDANKPQIPYSSTPEDRKKVQEYIKKRVETTVQKIMEPFVTDFLKDNLKTSTLDIFNGVNFTIISKSKYPNTALDTKELKFVRLSNKDLKVMPKVMGLDEFEVGQILDFNARDLTDESREFFVKVSEAWLKLNKRTRTKWVQDNLGRAEKELRDKISGKYSYWENIKKGEIKKKAEEMFNDMIEQSTVALDTKAGLKTFPIELVLQFVDGKVTTTSIENEEATATDTSLEPKEITGKALQKQEEKMKVWHEGGRGSNIKSMSDVKLKTNYNICKKNGYTKEADILKTELTNRNITVECISLNDFIKLNS